MARRSQQTDDEIVKEAQERFDRAMAWESNFRANALADARFANGDSINRAQWDTDVAKQRGNRPMLTFNKTRQHILQIVNDARQHKTQIKITPVGGRASYEAAQVFSGLIRRIEYESKAVDAYSTGIYHQVETGLGYARVDTEYVDEESFDQELRIRRVKDPRTILMDPDAQDYDKADMGFCFVFADRPRRKDEEGPTEAPFGFSDGWDNKDHIREAEYWRRTEDNDTIHLLADGSTVRESEMDETMRELIQQSRDVSVPVVEWFKIEGHKIVDRRTAGNNPYPGKYIPIVPFIGEEVVIDNVMDRKGHTRCLLDANRMYNYWGSVAAEQVALQTKTPYVGDARAFEGYTQFWDQANSQNLPWLPFNGIDDQGRPIERPAREPPPVMAEAYIRGMEIAREDMMMVSGQYQALVGAPSNEISGTAIQQRQRQGENSTYHYIDNAAKSIRQVGRICLDLIPKVYDVARVTKIMAEDGSESDVHVVPNAPQAHVFLGPSGPLTPQEADAMQADPQQPNPRVIFNPNVGRYDVEADVGPSFGTQRQEAANAFAMIMAQNPAAFQVVGDFWAANSDFPGADELAERLRRGLPPQYKADTPDPQVTALQGALQQTTQMAQQHLQAADQEIAALKAQLADKDDEHTVDSYKAETDRLKAVGAIDPAALQVIVRQMLRDMIATEIEPHMMRNAALNEAMQPEPEPAEAGQ